MASRRIAASLVARRIGGCSAAAFRYLPAQQLQLRCFSAAAVALDNVRAGEALKSKFISQIEKDSQVSRMGQSRLVKVEGLPITATFEDIRKLAREAAPPDGDKHIEDILFVRDDYFDFRGKCIVTMKNSADARQLVDYGNKRMVGGNVVRMFPIARILAEEKRRPELESDGDLTSASGRSVLFIGFPKRTEIDQMLGFLRSRNVFPAEGSSKNVIQLATKKQAIVSKFLVKLDSEAEAYRAVREFHNTNFELRKHNANYRITASVVY
ncbi:hypothetical protein VTP01DRAFT_2944 [Rhizomucor pusillus]|uniref:uncharacterized protein n=1 Tax=Rhizomucor pusillus TaxID=4840 RepID=UPI003743F030